MEVGEDGVSSFMEVSFYVYVDWKREREEDSRVSK